MATPLATQVNRGVAWAAAAQAIIAISDLISQLLVVKLLGVDEYGIAMMAVPLYTMLDNAADLGVGSALIQRDDHTPERVSTVFWFNMLVSTGLFVLLLGLGPLYGYFQGHAVVGWLIVAYGGKLVFQNVYAIPFALLRKELRFADIAVARTIAHLAESIGRIVYASLGMGVWSFTLAGLTRAFVFGVIMQLRHPFFPRFVFRPREVIDYVRFGLRSAASQVLYQLYTNLDYAVVGRFFGDTANGIYSLAYWIVLEPVKTIANVVIDVAFPTFARLREDRPRLVEQFIRFTRLNLIAVLPFVILILLVIPEFLHVFYGGGRWSDGQLVQVGDAARILCMVGLLRALGFLGPPLLDGIGRPELTLRYMTIASVLVPGCFVLFAWLFGGTLGFMSVAVAWAVGYPLAFAALGYLVYSTLHLPIGAYLRGAWGVIACCLAGYLVGLGLSLALPGVGAGMRMLVIGGGAMVVTFGLLAFWQGITPKSIAAAVK